MSFTDNLGFGVQTLILGMLIIFIALGIIWLVVSLLGKALNSTKKPKDNKTVANPAAAPQVPVVLADDPAVGADQSAEIVAAITAAICAYENKPLGAFRVVSFKKR